MRDNLAEIRFQSFVLEALVNSSGMGRDVHSFILSIKHFLSITVSPIPQDALKDAFGEAVAACDLPEPCKFPTPDSCQNPFWQDR